MGPFLVVDKSTCRAGAAAMVGRFRQPSSWCVAQLTRLFSVVRPGGLRRGGSGGHRVAGNRRLTHPTVCVSAVDSLQVKS